MTSLRTGVVTFGEVMIRECAGHNTPTNSQIFNRFPAGSEGNTGCALSMLGMPTQLVTSFPRNDDAEGLVAKMRSYGLDLSRVLWRDYHPAGFGHRVGRFTSYLGRGSIPTRVVVDRVNSAFSAINSSEFQWGEILANKAWFHTTGISAALMSEPPGEVLAAMRQATESGCCVSFDPNYRETLWRDRGGIVAANTVNEGLLPYVDQLFADPAKFVGGSASAQAGAEALFAAHERLKAVSFSSRTASSGLLAATISREGTTQVELPNVTFHDDFGGGDAFSAGIIYGNLQGWDRTETLKFAVALQAITLSIHGDIAGATLQQVLDFAKGASRINR